MAGKKILITGASGFIGSFLIEKALGDGFEAWAGVRKSSSKKYLQDERIRFVDFDYEDKKTLSLQLKEFSAEHGKFDYIIHNAGVTKCLDKEDFDNVNFRNTANFIDALISANCIPEKFILMSSLSVMGMGNEESYTPFKATDTPNPNTAYGKSKLKAEEYLKSQSYFPYLIFRPTGVYGPREKDYFLMIKTLKSGLNIGAGFRTQHLTFIYVKDLADAIFLGIDSFIKNRIYLVADGDVHTDSEYAKLIKELIKKKNTINIKVPLCILKVISIVSEYVLKVTKKPSTLNRDKYIIMKQRNWECDTQPLKDELNFTPKYNLRDGLRESYEWYRSNNWL